MNPVTLHGYVPDDSSRTETEINFESNPEEDAIDDNDTQSPNRESTAPEDVARNPSEALMRPVLRSYPKTVFGSQSRSFSLGLYRKFEFIEYSVSVDAVFCNPCRLFGISDGEQCFRTRGFRNWQKSNKIADHQNTIYHKNSVSAQSAFLRTKLTGTVLQQQLGYHASLVRENREYVKSVAKVAVMCARQNIALRGHDETHESANKGNFLEIVDLLTQESKEFRERRERAAGNCTYLTSDSQNALIEAGARCLLDSIQADVLKAGMFGIITDCCTDMVSDNLSVSIRYIDIDTGSVCERFLGFITLAANELDATSITDKIINTLQQNGRFCVPIQFCVAQASDGASVMSGKDNGVQKLMRDKVGNPCVFVHCYAHRLNLVLSVSATHIECAKEFFDLVKRTINFVNGSCKRKAILHDLQASDPDKPSVLVLPDMCDHKWNFRERSVEAIHKRFGHLLATLEEISENGKSDDRAEAAGLLGNWKLPKNICLLEVFSDLFSQLGPLSNALQAEACDLSSAIRLAATHTLLLEKKRSEEHFKKVWESSSVLASANNFEMTVPQQRSRKPPSRLRQFLIEETTGCTTVDSSQSQTAEDFYRSTVFYPVIDLVINEMKKRFADDSASALVKGMAACHPSSDNFLDYGLLKPLADAYHLDDDRMLQSQVEICLMSLQGEGIAKPADISSLLQFLSPAFFPTLRKVLQLALTAPIANVSAERSFSCMRRIRTYVRSTMTEKRLSAIANLAIEADMAKLLDFDKVVNIFSKLPSLRDNSAPLSDTNLRRILLS